MTRSNWTGMCLASLIVTVSACSNEATWVSHTNVETGFTATFPGTITDTMDSQTTGFGVIDTFIVESKPEGDTLTYRVRADFYPRAILGLGDSNSLIFARQKRYEYEIKGLAIAEEDISLGPHLGRELTFQFPGGDLEVARLFMVDTIMYQASVLMPADQQERPEIQKFLNSLELPDEAPVQ